MLNSKYAPIIALTVLGVIIIALLGWFLAVSPQLSDASDTRAQADEVRTNTVLIEEAAASIDQSQAVLDSLEPLDGVIATNAPSVYSSEAVRSRFSAAVESSEVQLVSVAGGGSSAVDGIVAQPSGLPSSRVAQLFQTGPVHANSGEDVYTPVVAIPATEGPVVENLYGVQRDIVVAGTPQQVLNFFVALADPEAPIFQLQSYSLTGAGEGGASSAGLDALEAGDVTLELSGYLYLLDPDSTVLDEEALTPAELGSESPFIGVTGAESE